MRRLVLGSILPAAVLVLVAGCTSGSGGPAASTSVETRTQTITRSGTPTIAPPISSGPTTVADASSCPLLPRDKVAKIIGMRLERIAVIKSGGKVTGCRYFPLQHPNEQCDATCLAKEDLPPGDQPAFEVTSSRYPDTNSAHNAFVTASQQGTNVQQVTVAKNNIGLCFQIDFYPKDKGTDWACSFAVGTTVVLVKTVVTKGSYSAVLITQAVATKF